MGTQKNRLNETVLLSTHNMLKLIGKKIFSILHSKILFIKTCVYYYILFDLDAQLKEDASKKAFQNFERAQMKATSQANPKEGVTSERFECEYIGDYMYLG